MEIIFATILALAGILEIGILTYLLILSKRSPKNRPAIAERLERANVFLALFFVISLGAFLAMNGPAYAENIIYDIQTALNGERQEGSDQAPTEPIFNLAEAHAASDQAAQEIDQIELPPPGAPMELVIPKINVRTPIVFPKDPSTDGVLKSLEEGVGAYPGSVLPGQKGHMILLGHSSRASWYNGDYARVFSLLKEMEAGDEFMIISGGKTYKFKVFTNQVFKPAAADVYLSSSVGGSVVDLVTCDPVGSASNRRVVSAAFVGVN